MPRSIDELKELLNRKHAYDYELARDAGSTETTEKLEAKLAELEAQLPRFGETVVAYGNDFDDCVEPFGAFVCLINPPPKEKPIGMTITECGKMTVDGFGSIARARASGSPKLT